MRPEPCISWCAYDKGFCRYCGWPKDRSTMPLIVWDASLNASREATQQDIDLLQAKADAYGRLVHEFRSVEHALFRKREELEARRTSAELSG